MTTNHQTEQWGIFELALNGSADGNPFRDVQFLGQFSHKHRTIEVDGFYDGAPMGARSIAFALCPMYKANGISAHRAIWPS